MFRPGFLKAIELKLGVFWPFSIRLFYGLAFGVLSLALFAKITEDLLFNELQLFDQIVTNAIRSNPSEILTTVMTYISDMGSPLTLIIIALFMAGYLLFVRKHLWDAVQIPVVLIGATVLNEALKVFFHRQRPSLIHLVQVSGLSYPSGHAMISFSFYGLLICLLWLNLRKPVLRFFLICLLVILILLIGISRIYLGVHYPSDVVAGFAAGSAWLVACILGLKGIRHYKASKQ